MGSNSSNLRASLSYDRNKVPSWIQSAPEDVTADHACSILAGVVTFGSTLALSTWAQQRILTLSTGTPPPLPTMAGLATVCLASLASHHVAVATQVYLTTGDRPRLPSIRLPPWAEASRWQNALFSYRDDYIDLRYVKIPLHPVRICCLGLLTFKLLNGRYWAIAPSSYTHLGSFARTRYSMPATDKYATTAQRAAIERMGRIAGCHTCGSRRLLAPQSAVHFIGDHMPPKSVAQQMNRAWHRRLLGRQVSFRFYPQCVDCSSTQGSLLSKATMELQKAPWFRPRPSLREAGGGANAYFHGWRPRTNHWTGGIVAAVAVIGATPADLIDSNRWRYAKFHRQIDRWIRKQLRFLRNE